MTISIRRGVFETNSSSTHSLTMCSKDEFDAWRAGNVYYNRGVYGSLSVNKDKRFVTKDELIEIITNSKYPPEVDIAAMDNEDFEDWLRENTSKMTYAQYTDDAKVEEDEYTTASGEVVVAISIYSEDR